MNSKKKVIILSIIIGLIAIVTGISVTYAYWVSVYVSNNSNILNSGCLNVEFKSLGNDISVSRTYPGYINHTYTDETLEELQESSDFYDSSNTDNNYFYFTITNTCTTVASYDVNLETLEGSDLDSKYLGVFFFGENAHDTIINKEADLLHFEVDDESDFFIGSESYLSDLEDANTTLDNSLYSKKLYSGVLGGRETHLFGLITYLARDVEDEESQEKTWNSKIVVNSTSVASANLVKVNLDTNMGEDSLSYIYVEPGKKYGSLPDVTRDGYILDHWYLEDDEDEKVTENTLVTKSNSHTLKAKWVEGTLLRQDAFYSLDYIKSDIKRIVPYTGNFYELDILNNRVLEDYKQLQYSEEKENNSSLSDAIELSDEDMEEYVNNLYADYYWELQKNGYAKVYIWYDKGTLYYYSDAPVIYINKHDAFGESEYYNERYGSLRTFKYNYLEEIDLSKFNTSRMTNMYSFFRGCKSLSSIDLSNVDSSNVSNMNYMFAETGIKSIDLTPLDTSNVESMSYMFSDSQLEIIDLSQIDTKNVVDLSYFLHGTKLSSIDLSSLNTSNLDTINGMFSNCNEFESIDLTGFNTENVTNMGYLFVGCTNLKNIDLNVLNTSNVESMYSMFHDCDSLISVDLSGIDTGNVKYMSDLFWNCTYLENVNLTGLNTTNVENMSYMFSGCRSLKSLNLSDFDTSNVSDFTHMFDCCTNLISLDLSNFNTSSATNMADMFHVCYSLEYLDVSSFDTSNVTTMFGMFDECKSLKSLDLSNFNTSNVENMGYLFEGCFSLSNLNLSNWNTSKVTNIHAMFTFCRSLTSLDLRSFDTSKLDFSSWNATANVFQDTPNLTNVILNCEKSSNFKNFIESKYTQISVECFYE